MKVILYSVPHTGTNFLAHLLREAGVTPKITHLGRDQHREDPLLPKVAPIRNPVQQYVTWQSRKTSIDCYEGWRQLNQMYLDYPDLQILPIDTGDRHVYLERMGEFLGVDLKTDWMPRGSGPRETILIPDLHWVYDLPVVRKFYSGY